MEKGADIHVKANMERPVVIGWSDRGQENPQTLGKRWSEKPGRIIFVQEVGEVM